ncbi:hypothetical protein LUZ60_004899 [Juncus effusus]|nr:hypothetical protein LUZ60_004899 [Juncus effusus]
MDGDNRSSTRITSDLLVEILSRVPPKSSYRFKCVSKSWLSLSSDPYYRKKLPQPPSALIYETFDTNTNAREINYTKISQCAPSINAPLGFLPPYDRLEILDQCNGLFLCSCSNHSPYIHHMFVCNPATRRWTTIPESSDETGRLVLAFDPHVSLHFHLLNFHESENGSEKVVIGNLEVFSSETGMWSQSPIEWVRDIELIRPIGSIFLNGLVHNLVKSNVMAIDPMAKSMELIPFPDSAKTETDNRIGKSQGSLLYSAKFGEEEIVVQALDGKKEWILKYHVNIVNMFVSDEMFFFS